MSIFTILFLLFMVLLLWMGLTALSSIIPILHYVYPAIILIVVLVIAYIIISFMVEVLGGRDFIKFVLSVIVLPLILFIIGLSVFYGLLGLLFN